MNLFQNHVSGLQSDQGFDANPSRRQAQLVPIDGLEGSSSSGPLIINPRTLEVNQGVIRAKVDHWIRKALSRP